MLCAVTKLQQTAGLKSSWIPLTLLPDFSSSFHIMHVVRPRSAAASGKVIVNRSAQGSPRCFCWILICERQTASRTGTAIVAERLRVSLCECFCETESVWGHAEWETFILLGHTADSHSPYSQTLTFFGNAPLDSDCLLFHAAQAPLPNHSFSLHHFAIS